VVDKEFALRPTSWKTGWRRMRSGEMEGGNRFDHDSDRNRSPGAGCPLSNPRVPCVGKKVR
jgi:hypothetical protein